MLKFQCNINNNDNSFQVKKVSMFPGSEEFSVVKYLEFEV